VLLLFPACLQFKLSLSDELMFAYMHYQLKGDWAAMEVKMHCRCVCWGHNSTVVVVLLLVTGMHSRPL
jgi:hypothetical protein